MYICVYTYIDLSISIYQSLSRYVYLYLSIADCSAVKHRSLGVCRGAFSRSLLLYYARA